MKYITPTTFTHKHTQNGHIIQRHRMKLNSMKKIIMFKYVAGGIVLEEIEKNI